MPNTIQAAGEAIPAETKNAKKRLASLVEEAATIMFTKIAAFDRRAKA